MSQFDFLEGNAAAARPSSQRRRHERVVTIQKTSKSLKGQQLMAWMTLIGSIALFAAMMPEPGSKPQPASTVAAMGVFAGVLWIIANRFQRWWHHG